MSCNARVLNWAIRENIRPVELAQYGPALLGVYPVLPSWGLCCGSSKNSPEGAPVKFLPLNFLSTRTHHIWPRFSISAMCYEGILNVENFERQLGWLTHQENTESVSPLRHLQSRSGKIFCQNAFGLGPCDAFPYCYPSGQTYSIGHTYIS